MHAFIKFNKGLMKMPIHWQLWLALLVVANGVIPLFFLNPLWVHCSHFDLIVPS